MKTKNNHILTFIMHPLNNWISGNKGMKTAIAKNGHFNESRLKAMLEGRDYHISMALRLVINIAMLKTKPTFMKIWSEMGDRIWEMADKYGDDINQLHSRKIN